MKIKLWENLFLGLMFLSISAISGQEIVDFVTFGADGNPIEGDPDFKQVFFIQVDENADDSLIIELFDIDCVGEIDQMFSQQFNSEFRFSLYGGAKAYSAKSITSVAPSSLDLYQGELIEELFVSQETAYDNKWIPFAHLDKKQGEFIDGSYYFKLLVEGLSGDDANVYNVRTVSKNKDRIKIINYAPTVHRLPNMDAIELRFNSGDNSRVIIKNYDADRESLFLITPYRSDIKLSSSGGGEWKSDLIELRLFEKNEVCAIRIGPGNRIVNDVIFSVKDQLGKTIAINLPITTPIPNRKPIIRKEIIYKDCNQVIFDATKSYDPHEGNISVKWVFPDGVLKVGFREEMVFQNAKKYPIVLAIKDNSNSVESGSYLEFDLTINSLPKAIAGDDVLKAPNEEIYFNAELSYDTDGVIENYNWDFGDGTSGTGREIIHTYSKPGLYNVKLTVIDDFDGDCNSNVDELSVGINAPPVANAGDDVRGTIDEIVRFDGSKSSDPDGHLVKYEWNFDDGNIEGTKIAAHSFSKAGKYNVTLKVTDNSTAINDVTIDNITVWVNLPPIANAGKDVEIAVDEVLTLSGSKSTDNDGVIAEYVWSSNGQFENSDEVTTHSFSKPGTYEVKLKVKDDSGTKSEYAEDIMIVTVNAPPNSMPGTDVYQTNSVVMFDAGESFDSDGEIIKYNWNFGDGSSSNMQSVEHYYKNSGEYKVTLTVQDNSPASNNTTAGELKVIINAKPIADAGPDQVVAVGEVFNLSAKNSIDSDGTIVLTEWFLEEELISSEKDFSYSLDKPGTYNIQLRVADNSKHQEAIDFDNVTIVVNASPSIISDDYYKIAVGETVNFDATKSFDSDGTITKYEWKNNNEVIGTDAKFSHKFDKAKTHRITLSVTDNSNVNNSVSEKSIEVFVNSSPKINYISDINSCSNSITLSASESFDQDGDVLSFTWDLGDGAIAEGVEITHNYNTAGSYPILLTVDDGHNLSNSTTTAQIKVKINSAPIANAGADEIICTGDIITLDASKSYDADIDLLKYEWDFGDSTNSSGISVNKSYNIPGLYTVTLKVSDNSGLECNYSYDTKILRVVESPVAFAGEDIIACSNKEVVFDASKSTDSDGIVNSFAWDFGDGNTGGGEKTTHIYKQAGIYSVLLTITGEQTGECDNVATDQLIVTVEEAPLADFTCYDSVAVKSEFEFNASLSDGMGNNIINYKWNFSDGTTGESKIVEHKFTSSGNYIVELTVDTDSKSGCNSSSIKKSVYVNDKPIAVAEGDLFGNVNQVLTFDASKSYDPNGKVTQYKWDFGDGTTKEGINVFHSYKESGEYRVTLSIKDETNLENNFATHEMTVEVNSPPTGKIELPEYGFVGKRVAIKGNDINDSDGEIVSTVWSIGDITVSSESVEHIFSKSGKHNILFKITDDKNATTQITKSIMIYELPRLTITAAPIVCIKEKVKLKVSYTGDNSDIKIPIKWNLANGNSLTGGVIEIIFSDAGIQKIEIVLKHPLNSSVILVNKEIEIYVNQTPVAKISDIKDTFIGGANDNILFNASESHDPDGNHLTYKWDMGDGNKYDGVKVFHTYLKAGNYTIKLTVSDNKNTSCSESIVSKKIKIISR